MILHKHDLKYKRYLKLQRQVDELWQQLCKVPLRELKEPYQRGWIVTYELKPEVKRRKDALILQEVADLCYTVSHIRKVEWVKVIRSGAKKVQLKNGKWHGFIPGKMKLKPLEYDKLKPVVKKYFELDTFSDLYKKYGHKEYKGGLPDQWMALKARPYMVTHERIMGGPLQKEHDRLEQELRSYWRTMPGGYSRSYPAGAARTEARAEIQKFIKGNTEDISFTKYRMDYD